MVNRRPSLRWKNTHQYSGEARLNYGSITVGRVQRTTTLPRGYFWYAGDATHGIPHRNTADEPLFATAAEAKSNCMAYVQQHIRRTPHP